MMNTQFKYRSTLLILLLSLSSFSVLAKSPEKGFYTIVDAYGRITIVANDNAKKNAADKAAPHKHATKQSRIVADKKPDSALEAVVDKQIKNKLSQDTSVTAKPSQNIDPTQNVRANKPQQQTINRLDNVQKDNLVLQTVVEQKESESLIQGTKVPDSKTQNSKIQKPIKEHGKNATHVETLTEHTGETLTSSETNKIKPSHTVILNDVQRAKAATNSSNPVTITSMDQRVGVTNDGLVDFQKGTYVDSQVLEDKAFNLKDEKRFYAVPNSFGGVDYVQKKSGVNLKNLINVGQRIPLFNVSSQYQTIDKKALMALLPSQCIDPKQLRKLKLLDVRSAVSLWPRPVGENRFQSNVIKLSNTAEQIVVQSFATREEKPTYYWPLPVFLDNKGCILEGVGSFYQESTQATWLQQSSLIGNLLAPKNASYLLLTPVESSQDLKQVTLTRTGQLRLSVHGGRK